MRAATCSTRSGSGRLAKARKPSSGSSSLSALKESAPARMRPSSSGITTCMARSAGASPRWLFSQASRRVVATITCMTGTPARSNSVSAPGSAPAAKAVAVTTRAGLQFAEGIFHEIGGGGILQTRDEDWNGAHAPGAQRLRQRIDRRDIRGKQHRTIEEDGDDGGYRRGQRGMLGYALCHRIVKPGLRHLDRFGSLRLMPPASAASRRTSAVMFSGPPSRK